MRVQDFQRVEEVATPDAIESALARRYGSGANAFWLSHGKSKYPALLILVNGELASLHYFPRDGHAGFRSAVAAEGLEAGGTTAFYMNSPDEEQPMLNDSVVPFSAAVQAAREFLACTALPRAVEWLEL